ncbi:MAG: glycosyltransferase [Dermatophilus congolensis]|nr:glycosyltransferase [Dermatophilus congolensis]
MPVPSCDVSFVTSGHDVADARLHREVGALVARGMSVEVLGLGDIADAPACERVRTWQRLGMAGRATLAARMASIAHGRVIVTLDPDSAVAAGTVVMTSGRVLVVDVHEDYAALLRDRPWAKRMGGVPGVIGSGLVAAFMQVAKRAELTVVADDHVPPMKARRRIVVRNEAVPALLPEPSARGDEPRALYIGDVRATRGVFAMVEAIRLAPAWSLDIVGPVAPADAERLDAALADPAVAGRVRLHGRRPPAASWEFARGAWCGLALLSDTPAFREALPSKLAEYEACGLPVISTDLPRQREVLEASGAGVLVPTGTDEEVGAAVAEVLRGWTAAPATLDDLRAAALAAGAAARERRSTYDDFADEVEALLTPLD